MDIDSTLSDSEQLLTVEQDTGYYVMLTARAFVRLAEKRLRPLGIGVAHMPVLAALAHDGPQSLTNLAGRARIEQPTATALLQRMDSAGLIERTPDPSDRRSTLISLSPRGASLLPEALSYRSQAVAAATADLSPAEVEVLDELLRRVLATLDAVVATDAERASRGRRRSGDGA